MSEKKELILRRGDIEAIAEVTGYTSDYVKKVLNLKDKRFNKDIWEAAELYIGYRNSLKAIYNPTTSTQSA